MREGSLEIYWGEFTRAIILEERGIELNLRWFKREILKLLLPFESELYIEWVLWWLFANEPSILERFIF